MESISKILKKSGWSSLISSVIFAILGLILIANPEGTIKAVSYILGVMFIAIGIYKIISYFVNKGESTVFNYNLAYGIISIILGVVTIKYSSEIVSIFRVIIGIWIIYNSIVRINLALELKNFEYKAWIYGIIISLIMMICGLYIIFTANAIIVTIGTVILIYSILDIIESIVFLGDINKIMK